MLSLHLQQRRVDLQDADITPGTRSAFDTLCEKYPKVFSKGNEDIGRTQLVTMNIDTGDSPLVSSRPYTLALKHHRCLQEEIETLERVGIITKSMSPWASPIVVVPKKSQPGEPPKKRLCINFRKINDLQQKVITEGKSKGCLSLIPLPKIKEMYTNLKGAKFFLTIDLRMRCVHSKTLSLQVSHASGLERSANVGQIFYNIPLSRGIVLPP